MIEVTNYQNNQLSKTRKIKTTTTTPNYHENYLPSSKVRKDKKLSKEITQNLNGEKDSKPAVCIFVFPAKKLM